MASAFLDCVPITPALPGTPPTRQLYTGGDLAAGQTDRLADGLRQRPDRRRSIRDRRSCAGRHRSGSGANFAGSASLDDLLALAPRLADAGLHAELCRLSRTEVFPIFGSSANLTNTGTRFRVQDIPQELIAIADTVVDHGLRKYHGYQRSATLINFQTLEVVRVGSRVALVQVRCWQKSPEQPIAVTRGHFLLTPPDAVPPPGA